MKYLFLAAILLTSCTKDCPTFTCSESYHYVNKSNLDFTREQTYEVKDQNSPYLTRYNPMTGVITWVKRSGTHYGTNHAIMYNTDVNFELYCK